MKYILWALGALVIVGLIIGGVFFSITSSFDQVLKADQPVYFTIESGENVRTVAENLASSSLIKKASAMVWLSRFEDFGQILAADYEFPVGFTLRQVYTAITAGTNLSPENQVTLIEGLTLEQMAEVLVEEGVISLPDEFIVATSKGLARFVDRFSFLESKPADQDLEGYLFPDTYRFFKDSTIDEIVVKILENFDNKLDAEMRSAIADSGRTIHEVVTLASIVEREVRGQQDQATVAGLFTNRLDINLALQADSTINYITKSGRDRSTLADLEIDSPYNTYKYPGLPPGPISNPGLSALQAALYPDETDFLYFLTDSEGGVHYATSFEGHQQNRQLYLN